MSHTNAVYLLGHTGAFLQWCPGCIVRTEQSDVIMARNPAGFKIELCKIAVPGFPSAPGEGFGEPGFMEAQKRMNQDWAQRIQGAKASWLQAIIGAPDGALLRWDNERGCVVDELAPDEEVFTDPFTTDDPVHCPVCGAGMVMDYDGGELVCSSDECDARQPIESPALTPAQLTCPCGHPLYEVNESRGCLDAYCDHEIPALKDAGILSEFEKLFRSSVPVFDSVPATQPVSATELPQWSAEEMTERAA